ncbi:MULTISPECIES: helix-turn-helix domain-containing protein [Halolamina]|uniref:HTH DNA binding domain-containing protein n=1 Tax=Halolamina pelagica TaxID=699431 RepID=A0A1I5P827_9EURY|nr:MULTISPECIES: helix-turn-helix domain-containing protein [Halolamina]NHX36676.1 DNA-binding protein [Halolamina sp. R1-12]SFP30107.1 HTH DNA binding domain-containing protein [Halolamina pelagica]
MKYVRLRVTFSAETINPVHAAICDADAVDRDVLLHEDRSGPPPDTLLYHVDGDPDAFAGMLGDAPGVLEWAFTAVKDGTFYAFVEEAPPEGDEEILDALSRTGIMAVPPIEFASDRSATLTVVGTAGAIRPALEGLPGEMGMEVIRVGEYDRRRELFDSGLTGRQREAIAAAVDAGYYDSPRRGSIDDVAAALDVAPSTAAEHLRKAESRVMAAVSGADD